MNPKTKTILAIGILILYLASIISFASAILVNADYVTIYSGESGNVKIKVENNENFDIESVSIGIVISSGSQTGTIISLPFSVVGS